jgi:hypothetical protein
VLWYGRLLLQFVIQWLSRQVRNIYGIVRFSPDARFFMDSLLLLWDSISQISTVMLAGYGPMLSVDSKRLAYCRKSSLQIWNIDSCPPKIAFSKDFYRRFCSAHGSFVSGLEASGCRIQEWHNQYMGHLFRKAFVEAQRR